MRLVSLSLHNIRSYKKETLTFPEGTVLLSGDIGSGKSTILLALEFALFGLKRSTLSGEGLLRHGSNEGSVELAFELDAKEITVFRMLKRVNRSIKQAAGYLIIDGLRQECTPTELKTKIFELLGYPLQNVSEGDDLIYRYTVYTAQEEMKSILNAETQERLNTLRRIMGLDKYKRIRENALLYAKELRIQIRELQAKLEILPQISQQYAEEKQKQGFVQVQLQDAKQQLQIFTELLQKSESNLQSHLEFLSAVRIQKEKFAHLQKSIDEKAKEYKLLKEKYQQQKLQVEELQQRIDAITEKELLPLEPFEHKLSELRMRHLDLSKKISSETKNQEQLLVQLQRANKECVQLREREHALQELEKKLSSLILPDITHLENKSLELQSELERVRLLSKESQVQLRMVESTLQSVSGLQSCPTCRQEVPGSHKEHVYATFSPQTEKYKQEITQCLQKDATLSKELLALKSSLDSARLLRQEFEILQAKKNSELKVREDLKRKEEERVSLQFSLNAVNATLSALETPQKIEAEIHAVELELSQLRKTHQQQQERVSLKSQFKILSDQMHQTSDSAKKVKELHSQLLTEKEALNFSEDVYLASQKNVESFQISVQQERMRLQQQQQRCSSLETEYQILDVNIRKLDLQLLELKHLQTEHKQIQNLEHWCSQWLVELVTTMEKHVFVKINREFNELFKAWFAMLVQDANIMVRIDDNFAPCIIQNGYEMEISHLSGGEKTAVALSFRLALNQVVNSLIDTIKTRDILILDEPTDGFSSEQLDRVKDVLDELRTVQTIIVSHDAKVESFVQSVIHVTKTEHESKIE